MGFCFANRITTITTRDRLAVVLSGLWCGRVVDDVSVLRYGFPADKGCCCMGLSLTLWWKNWSVCVCVRFAFPRRSLGMSHCLDVSILLLYFVWRLHDNAKGNSVWCGLRKGGTVACFHFHYRSMSLS